MTTEELVRAHIEAFNAGDLDRLADGLAEDVLWMTGSDVVRGRAAVLDLLAGAIRELGAQLHLVAVIADHDRAACELVETYVHEGVDSASHIAAFYELTGGLINRVKVYQEGSADP